MHRQKKNFRIEKGELMVYLFYDMKKNIIITLLLFLGVALFALTPEEELFSEAEIRYKAQNYSIALEFYDNFVKTYPLSSYTPDAQFRKALCLFYLREYNACLKLLDTISKRYKSTKYFSYLDFWTGMVLYYQKDYTKAIDNFNAFLAFAGDDILISQSLFYKGIAEITLESYNEAKDTILRLVMEYSASVYYPEGISLLAYIYYKLKLFDEIIALVETITTDTFRPKLQEKLIFYLAEAYTVKGITDKANTLYRKLLTSSPEISSVAYRRLFLYEQSTQNLASMEKLLQEAEAHFAGSYIYLADFWVQVGVESFKRGNLELAEHLLGKVWNIRTREKINKAIPLYRSEIQLKKKNTARAKEILTEYLKLQEDTDGSVIIRLGDINLGEKDYAAAAGYYEQYLKKFPGAQRQTEVSYFLAYTYYKQKNMKAASAITAEILKELKSGKYYKEFLKLDAYLLRSRGNVSEVISAFRNYLKINPGDVHARVDLFKLLFLEKLYNEVIRETGELFSAIPMLEKEDSWSYLLAGYLRGLSYVAVKNYKEAIVSLKVINGITAGSAGLAAIVPYAFFYSGWAQYKLGNFRIATDEFKKIIDNYSRHELVAKALYFTGWCYYSDSAYSEAVKYFSRQLALESDKTLAAKTTFFIAKSYANLDKKTDAAGYYKDVYIKYPRAEFADDAMFEYSLLLAAEHNINDAVKGLANLPAMYPESSLAQEASYKIGEIYFQNKDYKMAQESFYKYRARFPGGKFFDSALYWGGLAAYNIKEYFGALLVWEDLIDKYPGSVYRADAVLKTAEIHAANSNYSQSVEYYTILKRDYPAEAADARVDQKTEEIRYRILGLDNKEAELTALINRNKGANTTEGRKAILELAQFYIFTDDPGKLDLAYNMLLPVVEKSGEPEIKARALFLTGEYYLHKKDYIKAGNEFLKAAIINPTNKDQMAISILKAAEMMKLAGKIKDVQDLVKKLEENFPESQWTSEGKKLLEGIK